MGQQICSVPEPAADKINEILETKRKRMPHYQSEWQCANIESSLRNLIAEPTSQTKFYSVMYPLDCNNVVLFVNRHNNNSHSRIKFQLPEDVTIPVDCIIPNIDPQNNKITYELCNHTYGSYRHRSSAD
jgi:hypothetical protein